MPQWAKLSERIGQDGAMGELLETNPTAACLFTWSLAAADVYGILPADPREYRARVAAVAMLPADVIAEAIDAQERLGLVERYEAPVGAGMKQLLYIRNYHKYQEINWYRIHQAEYRLPDDWNIPSELQDAVNSGKLEKANKCLGPYGVQSISAMEHRGSMGVAPGEHPPSTPVAPPQHGGSTLPAPGEQDTNTDTNTNTDVNVLLSEAPCDAPAADTPSTIEQQLNDLRANCTAEDLTLIDEYLDLCAAENSSGTITQGRRVNETRALTELRASVGAQPWRYGLDAAVRSEVPKLNYVRKAAESWKPAEQRASPSQGVRIRGSGESGMMPKFSAPDPPTEAERAQSIRKLDELRTRMPVMTEEI